MTKGKKKVKRKWQIWLRTAGNGDNTVNTSSEAER